MREERELRQQRRMVALAIAVAVFAWVARTIVEDSSRREETSSSGETARVSESFNDVFLEHPDIDGSIPSLPPDESVDEGAPARSEAPLELDPLRRKWRCDGVLRDVAGNPVADADVIVYRPLPYSNGGQIVAQARTDEKGRYEMDVPTTYPDLTVAISSDGFRPAREKLDARPFEGRDFVMRRVD